MRSGDGGQDANNSVEQYTTPLMKRRWMRRAGDDRTRRRKIHSKSASPSWAVSRASNRQYTTAAGHAS